MLALRTLENHSIQFDLDQWGLALVRSPVIPVQGDGTHSLEIFVGGRVARATFPDEWHLDPAEIAAAEPFLRIWLDGRPVWTARISINRDSYRSVSIGSNPQRFSASSAYYRGQMEAELLTPEGIRSLVERNIEQGAGVKGLFRFKVEFPADGPRAGQPLLGAGIAGNGNLLFAQAESPEVYHLGMDDWGLPALLGKGFKVSAGEHDLEIVLGPVLAEHALPATWTSRPDLSALSRRFLVYVDHELRGNFQVTHHLDQLGTLTPGANPHAAGQAMTEVQPKNADAHFYLALVHGQKQRMAPALAAFRLATRYQPVDGRRELYYNEFARAVAGHDDALKTYAALPQPLRAFRYWPRL